MGAKGGTGATGAESKKRLGVKRSDGGGVAVFQVSRLCELFLLGKSGERIGVSTLGHRRDWGGKGNDGIGPPMPVVRNTK